MAESETNTKPRKGDTTRATNEILEATTKGYSREEYRSYLTAPEWRNVDMADEMAMFLKNGKPFYRYPYFSQIITFWRVFGRSLKAAHDNTNITWFGLIFSEYTVMNLFIGTTTTFECLLKGILSLPFRLLWRRENKSEFQKQVGEIYYTDYADYIHHTPFYQYPFLSKIGKIWKAYWNSNGKTFADMVTLLFTTGELLFRSIPGLPIRWIYTQPDKQEPDIIHVIIKHKAVDGKEEVEIKAPNQNLDSEAPDAGQQPTLAEKIIARKPVKDTLYSHVEFIRYEKFTKTVNKIAESVDSKNIVFKRIAGQDQVQVDFKANKETLDAVKAILGDRILYTYDNSIDDTTYIAAKIKTDDLIKVIREIKSAHAELKLIHDF
jgi:hypothetical protein